LGVYSFSYVMAWTIAKSARFQQIEKKAPFTALP